MPNIDDEDQPGSGEEPEPEEESIEDEVRRNAERHGGFDDEGRPVRPPPVEPELTEDEAKIAEEGGERGQSPDAKT